MKVYTLERSGFDHWNLVGIYNTRELAREDFEFIKTEILSDKNPYFQRSFTNGSGPMSMEEKYLELERFKDDKGKWEEEWHTDNTWSIVERDLNEISIKTKIERIKKWQKTKQAKDWKHCSGNPEFDFGYHLVLKCSDCDHIQSIPDALFEPEEPKKK